MSKTIDGVPEEITRKAIGQLLAAIGLDLNLLRSLRIDRGGIYAEVLALGADGKLFAVGGESAVHQVAIKIVDGLE